MGESDPLLKGLLDIQKKQAIHVSFIAKIKNTFL